MTRYVLLPVYLSHIHTYVLGLINCNNFLKLEIEFVGDDQQKDPYTNEYFFLS